MTLDEALAHMRAIAGAVDVPVNADFEGGFAVEPDGVAANVARAAATGIAGLSIEDSTGDAADPLFDFDARRRADPRGAARLDASGTGVLLTARSEGFIVGRPDLAETIRRLAAYAEAGAECLYAPGIRALDDIAAVVRAVAPKPVNVLVGSDFTTVAELADARRAADQRRRRAGAGGVGRVHRGGHRDRRAGHVRRARARARPWPRSRQRSGGSDCSVGQVVRASSGRRRLRAAPQDTSLTERPDERQISGACLHRTMTITRMHVAQETARRMRRLSLQNGEDIRRMRTDAGVSLGQLSEVVGVHKSHLARIEASAVQPSLEVLTAIGVALGADLGVRYFSGAGPRLHDRFQAPMLEAFLRCLHPRWAPEVEVPIAHPARGVIDLVVTDRSGPTAVACEIYSELRRLEQAIRWSAEKADGLATRLGREVARLLVVRSTVSTREIARQFETTLATAYPAATHDLVLALTTPTASWPGNGIVWMNVHGRDARLMGVPPTHVRLGR